MGMYTELSFDSELKKDIPVGVVRILQYMMDNSIGEPEELPNHPLFKTERWRWMFHSASYYFDGGTHSVLHWDYISKSFFLRLKFNIKNYSDEIENFIDWVLPYLNKGEGDFLGYYRYEEDDEPTLIYHVTGMKNE